MAAPTWRTVDECVEAFENARAGGGDVDLTRFLPPDTGRAYLMTLCELVRVDLEYGWAEGQPRPLEEYRARFPRLFADDRARERVAFEHFRLQRERGRTATPEEYQRLFAVDVSGWNRRPAPSHAGDPAEGVRAAAATYLTFAHSDLSDDADMLRGLLTARRVNDDIVDLFCGLHATHPADATRLARAADAMPAPGATLLGYDLVRELGRGPFARVFLARRPDGGAPVVVKAAADEGAAPPPLSHPAIVPVVASDRVDSLRVTAMPSLGPTTLAGLLRARRGRLPPCVDAVLALAARIAEGLAHAHAHGIVHGSLTPANVLLAADGSPRLLDFVADPASVLRTSASAARLRGALPYLAPEHLRRLLDPAAAIDARSDLYSLGLLLYELLTGRPAFAAPAHATEWAVPLLLRQQHQEVRPPRTFNPAVTPAVDAVVRRCLAADPEQRYPSAAELRRDLERHRTRPPGFLSHVWASAARLFGAR